MLLGLSFESGAEEFYRFKYKVEEGDTFASILKRFVQEYSIINAKSPLVKKTLLYNPHVKNWGKLKPETILELFITKDVMDLKKFEPYYQANLKKAEEAIANELKSAYPVGFKSSAFYMTSIGNFTQDAPNVANISFKQNSPVTLGLAMSYYPKESLYSMSASLYYANLTTTVNSLTTEEVKVPAEIGLSAYGEYRWQKYNLIWYVGPDIEKFSVFNLAGLRNDTKVYVDGVNVTYLTVGMAKAFTLFNSQFFTKFSLSKSIISRYSSGAPLSATVNSDFVDQGHYDGVRALFYLSYKFSDKFYLHSLFKYHSMSGPSNLLTIRVGFGVGYIFF